jgi:hypothetical protein
MTKSEAANQATEAAKSKPKVKAKTETEKPPKQEPKVKAKAKAKTETEKPPKQEPKVKAKAKTKTKTEKPPKKEKEIHKPLTPTKPVILFDLNGTLCYRGRNIIHVRPFCERLGELKDVYIVGVFSSMMEHNVYRVIDEIEYHCGTNIFDREYIFTRKHTTPFTAKEIATMGISGNKTKKCLSYVLPGVKNVTIIDDEIYKIPICERKKAVIVKSYVPEHQGRYADASVSTDSDTELCTLIDSVLNIIKMNPRPEVSQ